MIGTALTLAIEAGKWWWIRPRLYLFDHLGERRTVLRIRRIVEGGEKLLVVPEKPWIGKRLSRDMEWLRLHGYARCALTDGRTITDGVAWTAMVGRTDGAIEITGRQAFVDWLTEPIPSSNYEPSDDNEARYMEELRKVQKLTGAKIGNPPFNHLDPQTVGIKWRKPFLVLLVDHDERAGRNMITISNAMNKRGKTRFSLTFGDVESKWADASVYAWHASSSGPSWIILLPEEEDWWDKRMEGLRHPDPKEYGLEW